MITVPISASREQNILFCSPDQTSQVLDTRGPCRLQRGASEHTIFIKSNAKVHLTILIFQSNVQIVKNNLILTLPAYQIKHCAICFCNEHKFMKVTSCTLYMLPDTAAAVVFPFVSALYLSTLQKP